MYRVERKIYVLRRCQFLTHVCKKRKRNKKRERKCTPIDSSSVEEKLNLSRINCRQGDSPKSQTGESVFPIHLYFVLFLGGAFAADPDETITTPTDIFNREECVRRCIRQKTNERARKQRTKVNRRRNERQRQLYEGQNRKRGENRARFFLPTIIERQPVLNEPSTAANKYAGERSPTFKIFVLALYSTSTNKTCQFDVVPPARRAKNSLFASSCRGIIVRLRAIFARVLVAADASLARLHQVVLDLGEIYLEQ